MAYISLESVESSMISKIGYDRKTQTLRVLFTNGATYDYPTFTERDWAAFQEAESVGKHFHRAIKPTFAHRRVEERQLRPPCCEHDKPDDTCDESCLPCDPSCCDGLTEAQRRQRLSALAGGMARGQQLIESVREGAAAGTSVPEEIYGPPNPPSEGADNSDLAHTHGGEQHEHEGGDTAHTHPSEEDAAVLACVMCHVAYDPEHYAVGDSCVQEDCDDGVLAGGTEKEDNDGTED
jgi:hypothetical protein